GLICFPPEGMIELPAEQPPRGRAKVAGRAKAATPRRYAYRTSAVWVEVERNDEAFLHFVADAVKLITRRTMPRSAPNCGWCRWTRMTAPLLDQHTAPLLEQHTALHAAAVA
ncbi:MAG: hypothetical protein ACKO97_08720, partial [Actinomycetota bacterium]